jgi:hypothetical protein
LLEAYDINSPFFYEAFVDHTTGKIKWGYFCEANDTTYSVLKLKQELKDLNNGSDIIKKQENVSEITKEEFFSKYYECCKFTIVRDWIRYLWIEHSILLTLSDLLSVLFGIRVRKRLFLCTITIKIVQKLSFY